MTIIKLKAKVKLSSESDMELEELLEGVNTKSGSWVWRDMAFNIEDIYKIIAYDKSRTIIILQDGERILVKEDFDQLYNLWTDSLVEEIEEEEEIEDENTQISTE